MATVRQAFEVMMQNLELTEREQEDASRQQNVVRDNLNKYLKIDRHFLSGSYKRNTAIRPLNDIDIFIVLNEKEHGSLREEPPEEALKLVQEALQAAYPNKDFPIIQNRSVNIQFQGTGIGYDVVPSFEEGQDYQIPDRGTNRWIDTNPETHAARSTEANEAATKKLKPLVKAAKLWNRCQKEQDGEKVVKSFHLEVMAYEILDGFDDTYSEGLRLLFEKMADRVLTECPEPAGLGPAIDETMTWTERQAARTKFQEAAKTAKWALELAGDGRTEEAHNLWRSLLGTGYPEKGKEPKPEAPGIVAAAVNRSSVDASNARFG